jgi:hypothetical protein
MFLFAPIAGTFGCTRGQLLRQQSVLSGEGVVASDNGATFFKRADDPDLTERLVQFNQMAAEEIDNLRIVSARHDGQLSGLDRIIAGLQSTISSWIVAIIGVGSVMIGIAGFLAVYQVYAFNRIDNGFKDTNDHVAKIEERVNALQTEVKTLPAAVAQQILAIATSLAAIRGSTAPAPPPEPQRPR